MKKLLCLACLVLAATASAQQVYVNGAPQTFSLWNLSIPQPTVNGTVLTYTTGPAALSWAAAGSLTGSGTAGHLSLWSGASALTTDAGAIYDATNGNYSLGLGNLANMVSNPGPGTGGTNASGFGVVAIGHGAGANATYLYESTLVGNGAGAGIGGNIGRTDTGIWATFIGDQAGKHNTTGTLNTGVGEAALVTNTTGSTNTGVGSDVMYSNLTGGRNTAVGSASLSGNGTGSSNTAIGYTAMQYDRTDATQTVSLGATMGMYANVPFNTDDARVFIGSANPEWPAIAMDATAKKLRIRGDVLIASDGSLGSEALSNTTFNSNWSWGTGWTVTGGVATLTTPSGSPMMEGPTTAPLLPSTWYRFYYTIQNTGVPAAGAQIPCFLWVNTTTADATYYMPAVNGTYSLLFHTKAFTTPYSWFDLKGAGATCTLQIASPVSLKPVTGGALEVLSTMQSDYNSLTIGSLATAPTLTGGVRGGVYEVSWTNADVVALGANLTGSIVVATLPIDTVVKNAYVMIGTAATNVVSLTVSVGRTAAAYVDYIKASNAMAAANTVYGAVVGDRGANLTGYDLPSHTGTTAVYVQFICNANLNTVLTSTGTIVLETTRL